MNDKYSLQWFGFKAEGLISVLFVMGAYLNFINLIYPVGIAVMILAVILLTIDVVITLNDKARRLKRGW